MVSSFNESTLNKYNFFPWRSLSNTWWQHCNDLQDLDHRPDCCQTKIALGICKTVQISHCQLISVHRRHDFNQFFLIWCHLISLTTRPSSSTAEFSLCQTNGGATFKPANISDISKITKSEHRRKLRRTGVVKTIKCNVKLAGGKKSHGGKCIH